MIDRFSKQKWLHSPLVNNALFNLLFALSTKSNRIAFSSSDRDGNSVNVYVCVYTVSVLRLFLFTHSLVSVSKCVTDDAQTGRVCPVSASDILCQTALAVWSTDKPQQTTKKMKVIKNASGAEWSGVEVMSSDASLGLRIRVFRVPSGFFLCTEKESHKRILCTWRSVQSILQMICVYVVKHIDGDDGEFIIGVGICFGLTMCILCSWYTVFVLLNCYRYSYVVTASLMYTL